MQGNQQRRSVRKMRRNGETLELRRNRPKTGEGRRLKVALASGDSAEETGTAQDFR